jgi:hypothetical protein
MTGTMKYRKQYVFFWLSSTVENPLWSGAVGLDTGSLHVIEGTLTSSKYCQLIVKALPHDGNRLCGRGFLFHQGRAPCHTAKATTATGRSICYPACVDQSVDYNPIEHLWDEMGRRVQETKQRSLTKLKNALEGEIWRPLREQAHRRNIVDSMPNRCREVIAAKGVPTRD